MVFTIGFCSLSSYLTSKSESKIPNPRIVQAHDRAYLLFRGVLSLVHSFRALYTNVNIAPITITRRHTITFPLLPR